MHRSLCLQSTVLNIFKKCLRHTHTLSATPPWRLIINAALMDKIVSVHNARNLGDYAQTVATRNIPFKKGLSKQNSFHL